jgi:S1-C subfamily serine protease
VRQKVQAPTVPMPDMDEFLKRYFGDEFGPGVGTPGPRGKSSPSPSPSPRPREFFAHGLGSGVIVDAEKGYVLTNWHVVRDADDVEVTLNDDRREKAVWIRTDPQTDLAIIKINADGLVSAPLGDSDAMEVGYWVLAIGAPRGLTKTVTAGIISAKGRTTGGGGVTRSWVVAKVTQNMITDATAKIAMVPRKPSVSLPPPRYFTRGRTNSEMSSAPPTAPTNLKLDATARVRDEELITPSRDE